MKLTRDLCRCGGVVDRHRALLQCREGTARPERYLAQVNRTVQAAGWRVYDQYLKANQVEQGAASYGEVVRLVLGTQFSEDWVPMMRHGR